MKYVKMLLVFIFSLFIFNSYCKAETFKTGNYISNAYIKKINPEENNKIYYLQSQFIHKTDDNKIVYCVDPFRKLSETTNYSRLTSVFQDTLRVDTLTWNKIIAAAYLGYGYQGHEDAIWYSITQVYIWRLMAPNANIYFTSTLNGEKTAMYDDKLQQLDDMINDYYDLSAYEKIIEINYGETKEIDLKEGYSLATSTSLATVNANKLLITPNSLGTKYLNIKTGNNKSTYLYNDSVAQRLILVYAKPYSGYNLIVKVTSGIINLKFNLEDKYHSLCEENNRNIYGLYDENNNLIKEINVDEINNYTSGILNYGKYFVKQLDNTCQYEKDNNIYEIDLNESSVTKTITLVEKYKTIHLNHNICTKNGCVPEKDVIFEFKNDKGRIITTTDEDGNSAFNIGYGTYIVDQLNGDEKYYHYHDVIVNTNDYQDNDIYLVFNSYLEYADLTINVKDEDNNLVDDSLICLYGDNNTMSKCFKTVNGNVTFSNLKLGNYLIEQKSVGSKYIINSQIQSVDVAGNVSITIVNLLKDKVRNEVKHIDIEVKEEPKEEVKTIINYISNEEKEENIPLTLEENKDINTLEEPLLIQSPKTSEDKKYLIFLMLSLLSLITIVKISKKIN